MGIREESVEPLIESVSDHLEATLQEHIDQRLTCLFGLIEHCDPSDQARHLAHIEDRVREEADKLRGEDSNEQWP